MENLDKLSKYFDLVLRLIQSMQFSSLTKLMFTAPFVYYFEFENVGTSRKKDLVQKLFMNSGSIARLHRHDFTLVADCVLILINRGYIFLEGDKIILNESRNIRKLKSPNGFSVELSRALNTINEMSLNTFLLEVKANV